MARCLVSLGANLGDAKASVLTAVDCLRRALDSGGTVELSNLFETPPVGGPSGQATFVNAVAAMQTSCSAWQVWEMIKSIEQQLGRERIQRWEARRIDMDILLYEDQKVWTPQLKIPHPRMCMRRFILQPAAQVAANWIDPVSGWTIQQLSDGVHQGPGNLVLVAGRNLNPEQVLDSILISTGSCKLDSHGLLSGHTRTSDQRAVGWIEPETLLNRIRATPYSLAPSTNIQSENPLHRFGADDQTKTSEYPLLRFGGEGRVRGPKLLFFWMPASNHIAWEEYYSDLAMQLGLTESRSEDCQRLLPITGPRYLLASSDPHWVAHELSAALQAMDCTIRPISDISD